MTDTLQTINNTAELSVPESQEKWDILMDAFLSSLDVKEKTRQTYYWAMVQYFDWLRKTGRSLHTLTNADILSFKTDLLRRRLTPLTVRAYLCAVRQFYCWAENVRLYPNIARSVKAPRSKKGFTKMHLTEAEIGMLMEYLKGRNLRDLALVNLILRTGLRTVEVVRADIGDIKMKKGRRILYIMGKGQDAKDNFVMLSDAAWAPLKAYLKERGDSAKEHPLFVTDGKGHRGSRMSPRGVQYVCKNALRAIGLDSHEYSAHSLRHSTAVMLLKNGADWKDVQRVLRHSSPTTTQIYTASIEEELRLQRCAEAILDDAF